MLREHAVMPFVQSVFLFSLNNHILCIPEPRNVRGTHGEKRIFQTGEKNLKEAFLSKRPRSLTRTVQIYTYSQVQPAINKTHTMPPKATFWQASAQAQRNIALRVKTKTKNHAPERFAEQAFRSRPDPGRTLAPSERLLSPPPEARPPAAKAKKTKRSTGTVTTREKGSCPPFALQERATARYKK